MSISWPTSSFSLIVSFKKLTMFLRFNICWVCTSIYLSFSYVSSLIFLFSKISSFSLWSYYSSFYINYSYKSNVYLTILRSFYLITPLTLRSELLCFFGNIYYGWPFRKLFNLVSSQIEELFESLVVYASVLISGHIFSTACFLN